MITMYDTKTSGKNPLRFNSGQLVPNFPPLDHEIGSSVGTVRHGGAASMSLKIARSPYHVMHPVIGSRRNQQNERSGTLPSFSIIGGAPCFLSMYVFPS